MELESLQAMILKNPVSKDTVEKIKRQTADRKKILATISDKELVSRPHEDSYSPIIRKQNAIKKLDQKI